MTCADRIRTDGQYRTEKSNLLHRCYQKRRKKVVLQIACFYKVSCTIRADVTDPKYF